MTAILREIRELEAQLNRGDLGHSEYLSARAALLDSVEVAETDFMEAPLAREPARPGASSAVGLSIVVGIGVMTLCVGLTLLVLPDLNLALTLGVTVLAALAVTLLRIPDE